MTKFIITPINSYIGEDTALEVRGDLDFPDQVTRMFIIIEIDVNQPFDNGQVVDVDYGYSSVGEAVETIEENYNVEEVDIITPKNNTVG